MVGRGVPLRKIVYEVIKKTVPQFFPCYCNGRIDSCCMNGHKKEATIVSEELTAEERDILERFEKGELRPAPDLERELQLAREMARNTLNKIKRVNL